ncbi:MAG: hypothetical protein VXZ18_09040, partial [Pseudomonadota bacterium]|nr:hypothetical protein [Pseudomonadota bacterium]
NESTQKAIDMAVELESYKRDAIIREASKDLAETQVEKLKGLAENVDFDALPRLNDTCFGVTFAHL